VRLAILDSHPIQYHAPWYRELSRLCDLEVLYAHRQSSAGQARAGYGVAFDWDVDISSGYAGRFLTNVAKDPGVHHFAGCDTPELMQLVRAKRYDALIATGWYLKSYWQGVAACKLSRVPVLVRGDSQLATQRSGVKRAAKELIYPALLRAFDGYLSVGARNRAYLEHYRVPGARIFGVPHSVDTARFRGGHRLENEARATLRLELGAAGEEMRLALHVGRLVESKRSLDLIEAIGQMPARARARWVVACAGAGPLEGALKDRARALSVPLTMLGFVNQSELPSLYAAADVLALTSDAAETWGLVVNEAMAAGLPAVVSQAAGCAADMIEPGLTGFSYPCGDVIALGHALERAGDLRALPEAQAALARKTMQHSPKAAAEATLAAARAVSKPR
jgi:glycosyltransferase involved in cell wall biosynthesis